MFPCSLTSLGGPHKWSLFFLWRVNAGERRLKEGKKKYVTDYFTRGLLSPEIGNSTPGIGDDRIVFV